MGNFKHHYYYHFLPIFFLLFFTFSSTASANTSTPSSSSTMAATTTFIESSCKTTQYPSLCISTLYPYASTVQESPLVLARAATNVALQRLHSLKSLLSTMHLPFRGSSSREVMALKDCISNVKDAVGLTRSSLQELVRISAGGLNGTIIEWKIFNAQTWMSAALTDEDTCTDGLKQELGINNGDQLERGVVQRVDKVKMFSTNALALINNLKH